MLRSWVLIVALSVVLCSAESEHCAALRKEIISTSNSICNLRRVLARTFDPQAPKTAWVNHKLYPVTGTTQYGIMCTAGSNHFLVKWAQLDEETLARFNQAQARARLPMLTVALSNSMARHAYAIKMEQAGNEWYEGKWMTEFHAAELRVKKERSEQDYADMLEYASTEQPAQNKNPPKADAITMMSVAFNGNHSTTEIANKMRPLLAAYEMEITEDNLQRAGSALVSLRQRHGVDEMRIAERMLLYSRMSGTKQLGLDFAQAATLATMEIVAENKVDKEDLDKLR